MKKSLVLFLLIILCIPIFFACSSNTIWLTTQENIENFLNGGTDYDQFINGDITFSNELEIKRDEANSEFYDLIYYENALESCFINISKHYGSFAIAPIQNANRATTLCTILDNNLSKFIDEVEVFTTKKDKFLTDTNNLAYNNNIAISKLNSFKIVFYNLIIKANEVNKSFMNAYTTLYGSTATSQNATATTIYNTVGSVFADLLDTYITYGFTEFYGNCADSNNFYTSMLQLQTKLENSECSTTNFASWLSFYESFESEKTMFLTSLSVIDLTADNNDLSEQNQIYLDKINSFVNTNASLFINKTLTLFN